MDASARVEASTPEALTDKPDLTPAKLADLPEARVFRMPALAGSWSRCLDGLEHPYTKRIRPITFDHAYAAVSLLNLFVGRKTQIEAWVAHCLGSIRGTLVLRLPA